MFYIGEKIETYIHLEELVLFVHKDLKVWWMCVWSRGCWMSTELPPKCDLNNFRFDN